MEIVCTLLIWLSVMLNSIGSSSQSGTPAEPISRSRSRSPTLEQTYLSILGFRFEDLASIRLRPYQSPNRVYEIRRYIFPPDKPIRLRKSNYGQRAMPTGEQLVLSTSEGDVCAILDKASHRVTILRPICTLAPGQKNRVKINMNSGEVKAMTGEEMAGCPVSTNEPISKNYAVLRLGSPFSIPSSTASSSTLAEPPSRERSRSPVLRRTFPTILGYEFDDLASIKLAPHNNGNEILKLAIYALPSHEPIGLKSKTGVLNLIPTGDQIVLVTSDGDVCAILLKPSNRMTSIRPILTSSLGIRERVKINMQSGAVELMTAEEIAKCPGSAGGTITKIYRVFRA